MEQVDQIVEMIISSQRIKKDQDKELSSNETMRQEGTTKVSK